MRQLAIVIVTSAFVMNVAGQACADALISSRSFGTVLRYDEVTDEFIDVFAPNLPMSGPKTALALGPEDNVYVSAIGNASVLRYHWPIEDFLGSFTLGGGRGDIIDINF